MNNVTTHMTGTTTGLPAAGAIPAFDLKTESTPDNESWQPHFFHNFDAWPYNPDKAVLASDMAVRSSAAPTFFPTYQGFCDGGVACNSPALSAVAQAMGSFAVELSDIHVLSVGSSTIRYLNGQALNWGGLKWLTPIISIFKDAQVMVTDFQCRQMLGDHYHRLAPRIPEIDMDDLSKRGELVEWAEEFDLGACEEFVRTIYLKEEST